MENVFEPMDNFVGKKTPEQKSDELSVILQQLKKVEDIEKVKTAVATGGLGAGTVLAKTLLGFQNKKSSFNDFENFEGDDFSNFGLKEWFKSKFSTQSTPNQVEEKKIFGMPKKRAISVGVIVLAIGITTYLILKNKK